jgi:hypothetical protein
VTARAAARETAQAMGHGWPGLHASDLVELTDKIIQAG